MKKLLLLTIPLLFSWSLSNAQNSELEWAFNATDSTLGGGNMTAYSNAVDASGNTYVCGSFQNNVDFDPSAGNVTLTSLGQDDLFLAKYDASGNYVWAFSVGGASSAEYARDMVLDAAGNPYITGVFYSSGNVDFDPSAGTANLTSGAFIAKYDPNGNYVWANKIANTNVDIRAIAISSNDSLYITGRTYGTIDFDPSASVANLVTTYYNTFLAKYDLNGNYVWAKAMESTSWGEGMDVKVDASGNSYITGNFEGNADFDPSAAIDTLVSNGSRDIFVAKYDVNGNHQWAFSFGNTNYEQPKKIGLDASGNVFVTGDFELTVDFDPSASTANITSAGSRDIYLAKYNTNGVYQWAYNLDGTSYDFVNDLAIGVDDNVYLAGYTQTADFDFSAGVASYSGYFFAKYDNNGGFVWANSNWSLQNPIIALDGTNNPHVSGQFYGTNVDFDFSAGTAFLSSATGFSNMFVSKYTTTGDYTWAEAIGGYGNADQEGRSVATDAVGNIYVTGVLKGTADFDPSASVVNLSAIGAQDIYLAKYDSNGAYIWAFNIGSTNQTNYSWDVELDNNGDVYIAGDKGGSVDFDPSAAVGMATGNGRGIIAKYDSDGNYIWAISYGSGNCYSKDMAIDASNNLIVTGLYYQNADFDPSAATAMPTDPGGWNIYLAKYDVNGNYIWANAMGDTGGNWEYGNGVDVDASGNIFVTGVFNGVTDFDPSAGVANITSSQSDVFLAKYNSSGVYQWAIGVGGTGGDQGEKVKVDNSGNPIITGYNGSNPSDYDPSAGVSTSISYGAFLAKYTTDGDYTWSHQMGNSGRGYDLDVNDNQDVFVSGHSYSGDFDPSTNYESYTSNGSSDAFIAKYDSLGNYQWVKGFGGTGYQDHAYSITLGNNREIYSVGTFEQTADFDPTAGTLDLSAQNRDLFVLKLRDCRNSYTTISASDCDSYTSPSGKTWLTTNTYMDTLTNAKGCDSIITVNLVINNTARDTLYVDVCSGDNYTYADATAATNITANQNHTSTFTGGAANTCDSIVIEYVNVLSTPTETIAINVCSGDDYTYADATTSTNITANESHVSTLANAALNGCDSIVTENITSLSIPTETVAINVCSGDNYTYADATTSTNITANESHVSTLANAANNGCDSIVTENLTSLSVPTETITVGICSGGNYTYADATTSTNITANESHVSTLVNAANNGCDSIVTENLVSLSIPAVAVSIGVCNGNDHTYADGTLSTNITADESHVSTLVNAANNGCDSIVTENLTVLSVSVGNQTLSSCDSLDVNGVMYYSTQIVSDTFAGINTCDSIIVTDLTIYTTPITNETQSNCDSLDVNGTMYYSTQMVYDTLTGLNCDSIVITDLTINTTPVTNDTQTSCDSMDVNGTMYFASQMVYDTLSGNNCDSIVITDLTINNAIVTNEVRTVCGPTTINGNTYSTSQIVTDVFTSGAATGCDSTHITDLTVSTFALANVTMPGCDSLTVFGMTYSADTVVSDTMIAGSVQGCDSITVATIVINMSTLVNQSLTGCDSMMVNGTMYFASQTINDTITGANCDSIVVTDLMLGQSTSMTVDTTIAQGTSITVGTNTYNADGTYMDTLATAQGCDSIVTTNLTVADAPVDGINNLNAGVVNVYPNPTKGSFTIKSENGLISSISIVDVQGKEQMEVVNVNNTNEQLDISNLADGVYFMKLTLENGSQSVTRVTKMK